MRHIILVIMKYTYIHEFTNDPSLSYIDNVCIESMSINISRKTLDNCTTNINNLQAKLRE